MSLDYETKKKMSFHEIKYGHRNIIHINNNTLDNRSDNIEIKNDKKIVEDNEANIITS